MIILNQNMGKRQNYCYTDTDSLIYEIETEDFYEDIKDDLDEYFDTSDYPADHPSGLKSQFNKKKIGKFKDEALGKIISEFVALRSKSYSFKTQEVLIETLNKIIELSKLKKDKYLGKLRKPNRLKNLIKEIKISENEEKKCKGIKNMLLKIKFILKIIKKHYFQKNK